MLRSERVHDQARRLTRRAGSAQPTDDRIVPLQHPLPISGIAREAFQFLAYVRLGETGAEQLSHHLAPGDQVHERDVRDMKEMVSGMSHISIRRLYL